MIIEYLNEIMSKANYEILEGGEGYYGEISVCPGVWAQANSLEECRKQLQEVLEEWIVLKIRKKNFLPKTHLYNLNELLCEK